jgi:hypothetical protein
MPVHIINRSFDIKYSDIASLEGMYLGKRRVASEALQCTVLFFKDYYLDMIILSIGGEIISNTLADHLVSLSFAPLSVAFPTKVLHPLTQQRRPKT